MILSTVGLGISQRHRHCSDRYCRSHDSVIATCNKIESYDIYLARDYGSCDIREDVYEGAGSRISLHPMIFNREIRHTCLPTDKHDPQDSFVHVLVTNTRL
jgi:hypothetical protein